MNPRFGRQEVNVSESKQRCAWAGEDPLNIRYHDKEWGVPIRDDKRLFELLILEGAQAGLSWLTVLRKRDAYRSAYREFDPRVVARFGARDRKRLLADEGIVRNRAKIEASIRNANAFLELAAEEGSFAQWLWSFVDGKPVKNRFTKQTDVPSQTPLAEAISKQLKQRGFSFVGPTIIYAYLEAVGVVDDHLLGCFKRARA
jgi:DNA-3-methyladenine glycosylase I